MLEQDETLISRKINRYYLPLIAKIKCTTKRRQIIVVILLQFIFSNKNFTADIPQTYYMGKVNIQCL